MSCQHWPARDGKHVLKAPLYVPDVGPVTSLSALLGDKNIHGNDWECLFNEHQVEGFPYEIALFILQEELEERCLNSAQ